MNESRRFVEQINTKNLARIRHAQHSDLYAHLILEHNIVVRSHQLARQEARGRLEDARAGWRGFTLKRKGR